MWTSDTDEAGGGRAELSETMWHAVCFPPSCAAGIRTVRMREWTGVCKVRHGQFGGFSFMVTVWFRPKQPQEGWGWVWNRDGWRTREWTTQSGSWYVTKNRKCVQNLVCVCVCTFKDKSQTKGQLFRDGWPPWGHNLCEKQFLFLKDKGLNLHKQTPNTPNRLLCKAHPVVVAAHWPVEETRAATGTKTVAVQMFVLSLRDCHGICACRMHCFGLSLQEM